MIHVETGPKRLLTNTVWMRSILLMPDAPDKVDRLDSLMCEYVLIVVCKSCGGRRHIEPRQLAHRFGLSARLADLKPKFRCIRCGARDCALRYQPPKRRGAQQLVDYPCSP